MSTELYAAQAAELSHDHTLIRIDGRGHGLSGHGEVPYTYWDQVDDVVAVLDAEGVDTAVVAGHSQGGFIALRLALAHPDRVTGLILIGTEAGPSPADEQAGYRELFAAWDEHGPTPELTEPLAGQIIGDPELGAQWAAKWQARTDIKVGPAGDCLLDRDDITDRLEQVTCPAILIRGAKDQAISAERAQSLIDRLPDLQAVVTIPGAAHAPQLSHPQLTTSAMRILLDRAPTDAQA